MIRVELPQHLRTLAKVGREVQLEIEGPVTQRAVLDALEARYPMLCGTIRDHVTQQRRAFLRFFACEQDLSHDPPDTPLPEPVASGREPFLIIGAIAGGSTCVHDAVAYAEVFYHSGNVPSETSSQPLRTPPRTDAALPVAMRAEAGKVLQ